MITIDEMTDMLDEIAESFPPKLFFRLNGGINVLPDVKLNPRGPGLYILGEYHYDSIFGRSIIMYYGSISLIYGHVNNEQMKAQLSSILKHEFRHHLESLAGDRSLEIDDELWIRKFLND
jgi:hypothetical protein